MDSLALDCPFRCVIPASPSPSPLPVRALTLCSLMTLPFRLGMALSNRSLSFQESAAYEFLSVDDSERKWKGPALSQRARRGNVMPETHRSVASWGNGPVPQSLSSASFTVSLLCSFSS